MAFKKRRVWTGQPQEAAELDWSNDLLRGAGDIWLPAHVRHGLVSGKALTNINGGALSTAGSSGLGSTTSGQTLTSTSGAALDTGYKPASSTEYFTVFALFETFDAPGSTGFGAVLGNDTAQIQFNHSNAAFRRAIVVKQPGVSVYNKAQFSTPTVGVPVLWVGTYDGTSVKAYTNGQLTASDGTGFSGPFDPGVDNFRLHSRSGGYAWNGRKYLAGAIRRAWSADEVREFSQRAWQLFAPQTIWVPVSAGGGGATSLTVADATHAHTLDNVVLTSSTALAAADIAHDHALDNVVLSTSGSVSLIVADMSHGHALDAAVLTTDSTLAATDLAHAQALDAVVLTSQTDLVAADLAHGHALDGVTLTLGGVNLVIADIMHAHTLDNVALTLDTYLAVADLLHAHTIDNVLVSIPGGTLDLILKILRNRQELNPATGTFTLYDDDGVTVLYTTSAWADAAGTVPYSGGALRRIDALI